MDCKFASLQKMWYQTSMRGRAGGLQAIRGIGLSKPELLAQQGHRHGSSTEKGVGK